MSLPSITWMCLQNCVTLMLTLTFMLLLMPYYVLPVKYPVFISYEISRLYSVELESSWLPVSTLNSQGIPANALIICPWLSVSLSVCHHSCGRTILESNLMNLCTVVWDRNKKAQLTLSNPRDVKACQNCSNSTCFVSFHRIPFPQIANA